jgi:hypothetical protein
MPTANVQTQTRLSGIVKSHREVNDILKVNRDKHAKELEDEREQAKIVRGKLVRRGQRYRELCRKLTEALGETLDCCEKKDERSVKLKEENEMVFGKLEWFLAHCEKQDEEIAKLKKENAWLREYFERAEEKEQEDLYADCK